MGQAVSLILHDFQDNEFPWIFNNNALLELLNVAFGWPEVGLSGLRKHARIKAKAFFKAVNQKKPESSEFTSSWQVLTFSMCWFPVRAQAYECPICEFET